MSNTTTAAGAPEALAAPQRPGGLLASLLSAIIAWRESEAERIVNAYLATLSDERLRELGYDPADVRAKGGRGAQFSAWS